MRYDMGNGKVVLMRRYQLLAPVLLLALACSEVSDFFSSENGNPVAPSAEEEGVPFSVTDVRVGTGPAAVNGQSLTVDYTGWLYDANAPDNKGVPFDSGQLTFTLGAGAVIDGWDQGLVGMNVGGLRRIVIPPEVAYGSAGHGIIPPNATLIFDVELLSAT